MDDPGRGAGDHDSIARVVAAAFGSAGEAQLVEAIRASADYLPQLSMVAELEGQIVGHVMISHVRLEDGDVDRKIASLSPLAVAPDFQGRGIGSDLVRVVVARADDRGESSSCWRAALATTTVRFRALDPMRNSHRAPVLGLARGRPDDSPSGLRLDARRPCRLPAGVSPRQ